MEIRSSDIYSRWNLGLKMDNSVYPRAHLKLKVNFCLMCQKKKKKKMEDNCCIQHDNEADNFKRVSFFFSAWRVNNKDTSWRTKNLLWKSRREKMLKSFIMTKQAWNSVTINKAMQDKETQSKWKRDMIRTEIDIDSKNRKKN